MAVPVLAQNSNNNQSYTPNQNGQYTQSYNQNKPWRNDQWQNGQWQNQNNNNQNNNSQNQANVSQKSISDQAFLQAAAKDTAGEIQIARLAQQKSSDSNVRQAAQQLMNQEQQKQQHLQSVAQQEGVNLNNSPTAAAKARYDKLSQLSGSQFDSAFMHSAVAGHLHELPLLQYEANNANSDAVRNYAQHALSLEQQHLSNAESVAQNVGINFPGNAGQAMPTSWSNNGSNHYRHWLNNNNNNNNGQSNNGQAYNSGQMSSYQNPQ